MKSKWIPALTALALTGGCGGDDGPNEQPLGGQYTVKTALVSTNCTNITLGQGNTHTANVTKSGSSVTISDSSGLSLSGSLGSGDALTASGTLNVQVNGFCTTSNTVNLTANVPESSTIEGTARIQISFPGTCQRLSGRTCSAELKYEAVRPSTDGTPSTRPSTIPAGTLLWGNATRLGGGGTYPAVEMDSTGKAHALYRRDKNVFYRYYNGTTWGAEQRVNDEGSRTESEIKDRNLPKVAIDDQRNAWLLWGADLPDLFIYIRKVDQNGAFASPITQLKITDVLPNMGAGGQGPGSIAERPEETALAWSNTDKRLHVTAVYVGDSDLIPYDQRRDGVYDLILNPVTLRLESGGKLGNASKNLYTISGPMKVHGFFRLNIGQYFRHDGGNTYVRSSPASPPFQGNIGAFNLYTRDDQLLHVTAMSTYPVPTFTKRQLSYARYNPALGNGLLEAVIVEKDFASPIGIPPVVAFPGNQVLIAYDRHNPELTGPITNPNITIQEVGFAWRLGGAAAGSPFVKPTAPFLWPGRTVNLGQEPAISLSGNTLQVVWDGKQTGSFDATSATFQQ